MKKAKTTTPSRLLVVFPLTDNRQILGEKEDKLIEAGIRLRSGYADGHAWIVESTVRAVRSVIGKTGAIYSSNQSKRLKKLAQERPELEIAIQMLPERKRAELSEKEWAEMQNAPHHDHQDN